MAKAAKLKNRTPSKHSRAARRETSPSLNTDKSLKDVAPPVTQSSHNSSGNGALAAQYAGVSKKKKPTKKMSRLQRVRHEKGLEKALSHSERLATNVQKSIGRERRTNARRADWDQINGKPAKAIPIGVSVGKGDDVADEMEEVEATGDGEADGHEHGALPEQDDAAAQLDIKEITALPLHSTGDELDGIK